MKILVAEDNAPSLYLLEQFLTAHGHEVWSAPNGRAALDLCTARGAPDLVVSDALMPVLDGFELCDTIRRTPELAHLPFVLYTATYTAESDERFALSIGVDRFVVKPTEPELLVRILEEVHAAVSSSTPRAPRPGERNPEQIQEYAHLISVKLEDKLAELSRANEALQSSESSVRHLNDQLVETVSRLRHEVEHRKRSEALLRLAQEAGGIGTWECDAAGAVRWSAEAARLLRVQPDTPLAELLDRFPPEDRPHLESLLKGGPAPAGGELELPYNPPGERPLRLFFRGGQPGTEIPQAFRLGIVQDVTLRHETELRRQTLEQQLFRSQKMEALGKLAGGVAHDFNNILTGILGHAELLTLDPDISGESRTSAAFIVEGAQRARGIIDQILTFSRRQSIERKPLRLASAIESAVRLVRSTIGRDVQILCHLDSDQSVVANETQIHQILLNLCTNAAHAMRPAGGTITVALSALDLSAEEAMLHSGLRPGPHVRLDVQDTGSGMDTTILEHLFEPFFTTKAVGEGTGLGLAVVHGIVNTHEGAITVHSEIGHGSTFTILLPALAAGEIPSSAARPTAAANGAGRHVLVVDDEPGVARTCGQLLQRLGYEATTFTDPREALEHFARGPGAYSAALVDFIMPHLTGPELAQNLWAKHPDLPVILIAGFGTQLDTRQARAEGFGAFLTKPFTLAKLGDALNTALRTGTKAGSAV